MDENDQLILNSVTKSNQLAESTQAQLTAIIDKVNNHYIPTIMPESSEPDSTKAQLDNLVNELVAVRDSCARFMNQDDTIHQVHNILTGRRETSIRMEEKVKWLTWITDMMRDLFSALCTKQALSGSLSLSGNGNWPILNAQGFQSGSSGYANASGSGTVEEKETRPQIGKPVP